MTSDYLEGLAIGATIMFVVGVVLMAMQPRTVAIKTDRLMPAPHYQQQFLPGRLA